MEQRNEITGIDNHRSNYHTNLFFYGIVYACYSVNVSFHFKHIAEALAADNVSSICADFLTEAGDMDVDGAVGDDDASPDSVHELLAGEDISTILQQEDEQVELSTCEVDGLAVDADGPSMLTVLRSRLIWRLRKVRKRLPRRASTTFIT